MSRVKQILKNFKTAPWLYFISLIEVVRKKLIQFISTIHCSVKMSLLGISYGKHVVFRGNMIFSRAMDSAISMGNCCTFNSNDRFNFRGINHHCIIQTSPGGNIRIGNNCGFSGVSIVSSCRVTIGDNVLCGTNVMIADRNDHEDRYPQFRPAPVTIGNNVWIGMNSVIMKGVTIGENTIIGANSVVTKDIPANVIAAGIPCKVIRQIDL